MTPRDVIELCAAEFKIPASVLVSERRDVAAAQARHVSIYLCREVLRVHGRRLSLPEIGAVFDRDHTSVLHAVRVVRDNPDKYAVTISRLTKQINARMGTDEHCPTCGRPNGPVSDEREKIVAELLVLAERLRVVDERLRQLPPPAADEPKEGPT